MVAPFVPKTAVSPSTRLRGEVDCKYTVSLATKIKDLSIQLVWPQKLKISVRKTNESYLKYERLNHYTS
jgi:hypothetical protein